MNDVKLGTFEKSKVADDAVAEAAFALDKNDVSDVVQGTFGPILVRVTDITPEVVKPLADVKDDIRRELALDEATRVIYDVYDSYEDARAGGATMQEAAKKLQLEVKTVDAVSRTGETPDGDVVKNLPESADLLREIYETDVDVDNPPLNIGSVGFVFYEVDDIMSARDRTLEEVHDKVFADWKESETESRLSSLVADNRKALDDGKSLDDIATEAGLQKDTKRGLKREADDSDLGKRGVAKVFSVAKGQSGVTPTAARDGQVLFQVTESFEPVGAGPDAVPENARTTFASGISDDLLDQLVQRLQGEYDISINRRLIETAMSF